MTTDDDDVKMVEVRLTDITRLRAERDALQQDFDTLNAKVKRERDQARAHAVDTRKREHALNDRMFAEQMKSAKLKAELIAANAREAGLVEALEPFASVAPFFEQRHLNRDCVFSAERQGESVGLLVRDFRRASEVVSLVRFRRRRGTKDR